MFGDSIRRTTRAVARLGVVALTACSEDPVGGTQHDFAYRVQMDIAESFPVQIGLRVEVENIGDETATVSFNDGCVVLMRVYDGDEEVWDLGHTVACAAVIVDVTLDPGQIETFEIGLISAAEILGDTLPDGEYRVAAYVRPGKELELDAGTVNLAIQR